MLVATKVGQYTDEEFEIAYGHFNTNHRPFIYTYFKKVPFYAADGDWDAQLTLRAFQDKLRKRGHYWTTYEHVDGLKLHIDSQLEKLFGEGASSTILSEILPVTAPTENLENVGDLSGPANANTESPNYLAAAQIPAPGKSTQHQPGASGITNNDAQRRYAVKHLGNRGAASFLASLQREINTPQRKINASFTSIPADAESVVGWFAEFEVTDIREMLNLIRRSLRDLPLPTGPERRPFELAASAVYLLAACRLVSRVKTSGSVARVGQSDLVVRVASDERLVCAIIATALFGGELRLVASDTGVPQPEAVFSVRAPSGGDWQTHVFDRAAYVALFPNSQFALSKGLDDSPLDAEMHAEIDSELNDRRNVERSSLALMVAIGAENQARNFASIFKVPVLLHGGPVEEALIGMNPLVLMNDIRRFWNDLQSLSSPNLTLATPHSMPTPISPPVPTTVVNVNVQGSGHQTAVSAGANSMAQVGPHSHAGVQLGIDAAILSGYLERLEQAISELRPGEGRDSLAQALAIADHEAGKGEAASPGAIVAGVDKIKSIADAVEGGARIAGIAQKAVEWLATVMGS
jgi:hypothetical protein